MQYVVTLWTIIRMTINMIIIRIYVVFKVCTLSISIFSIFFYHNRHCNQWGFSNFRITKNIPLDSPNWRGYVELDVTTKVYMFFLTSGICVMFFHSKIQSKKKCSRFLPFIKSAFVEKMSIIVYNTIINWLNTFCTVALCITSVYNVVSNKTMII